jgi:hypothetical protein
VGLGKRARGGGGRGGHRRGAGSVGGGGGGEEGVEEVQARVDGERPVRGVCDPHLDEEGLWESPGRGE